MNNPDLVDRVIKRAGMEAGQLIVEKWNLGGAILEALKHGREWGYDAGGAAAPVDAVNRCTLPLRT